MIARGSVATGDQIAGGKDATGGNGGQTVNGGRSGGAEGADCRPRAAALPSAARRVPQGGAPRPPVLAVDLHRDRAFVVDAPPALPCPALACPDRRRPRLPVVSHLPRERARQHAARSWAGCVREGCGAGRSAHLPHQRRELPRLAALAPPVADGDHRADPPRAWRLVDPRSGAGRRQGRGPDHRAPGRFRHRRALAAAPWLPAHHRDRAHDEPLSLRFGDIPAPLPRYEDRRSEPFGCAPRDPGVTPWRVRRLPHRPRLLPERQAGALLRARHDAAAGRGADRARHWRTDRADIHHSA